MEKSLENTSKEQPLKNQWETNKGGFKQWDERINLGASPIPGEHLMGYIKKLGEEYHWNIMSFNQEGQSTISPNNFGSGDCNSPEEAKAAVLEAAKNPNKLKK